MKSESVFITCRRLLQKNDKEPRISKTKVLIGTIIIFLLVFAVLTILTMLDYSILPEPIKMPFSFIKSLSQTPIAISFSIILVVVALAISGFTVAKVGELEYALYDDKGNTVMDEVKKISKKVDTINSRMLSKGIKTPIKFSAGLQKANYTIPKNGDKNGT